MTAPINRTVYMEAPEGFERPGYCIRLGMNIYGTADAPRAYHRDSDKYLAQCVVFPEQADTCLYTSQNPRYPGLQLIEYVDDLVCRGSRHPSEAKLPGPPLMSPTAMPGPNANDGPTSGTASQPQLCNVRCGIANPNKSGQVCVSRCYFG